MLLQLFKALLITSAVGSAPTILLLLLKPVTKRCFGSAWQYYIWAIVLVVMILPVTISLPQIVPVVTPNTSLEAQQSAAETMIHTENNIEQVSPVVDDIGLPLRQSGASAVINAISLEVTDIISYVWLVGLALMLGLNIVRYLIFLGIVRKNSVIIPCHRIGKIITRKTSVIDAPLMAGLFRPVLLLPDIEMSEENLNNIFLHEITHYKRFDLIYKWFAMLVKAIHWFNPFVYIVSKQIDEECEISCDLSVVANMNEQEQNGYMNTILTLISASKAKKQILTTAMAINKKQIKRRFLMIRNAKKKSKTITLISVIAALAIFATTVYASGILSNINQVKEENIKDLQNIVMQEYSKYDDTTFIFMNPSTGEILACAGDIDKTIEPAATFKYIPLSIALNEKLVTLEDSFECTGSISLGAHNIRCWKHEGHGSLSLSDAVDVSCVISSIEIVEPLNNNEFFNYLENFGIANSNNAVFHNRSTFNDLDAHIASIGQAFAVKPLQLLLDYAALVNGGNIPRVYIDERNDELKDYDIEDYVNSETIAVITPETSGQILTIMNQNSNDNILIFGGQAERLPRGNNEYVFSAFAIAPSNNPEIIGIALGYSEDIENIENLQDSMRNIINSYYRCPVYSNLIISIINYNICS